MRSEIEELQNKEIISDRTASKTISKEKVEREEHLGELKKKDTILRNRLQKSGRKEFIIDLTQHPEKIAKKDEFALQYRGVENSGIEIDGGNEVQGGGIEFGGAGADSQSESGNIRPGENKIQKQENQL